MKKQVAILQLEIFKSLYKSFDSKEFQDLLGQLKSNPESSENEYLQIVFKNIDELKGLYEAANKETRWAPVHLSVVGMMFDRMQNIMYGITKFSEEARGDPSV